MSYGPNMEEGDAERARQRQPEDAEAVGHATRQQRVMDVRTFHRQSDLGRTRCSLSADDGGAAAQSATALQRMSDRSCGRGDRGGGQT